MRHKTILEVKNLNVEFGDEKVIENISFEVNKGDIFTILGPNGAGKSVLLRTLLGLLPYRGEIKWEEGIKTGYVPQRLPFVKNMPITVREFLKLKKNSDEKVFPDALSSVGLKDNILNKSMGILSSGQFQRVLIVWGLLANSDVLLFDEPTAGIDVGGEETVYTLLKKLQKEKDLTIVLVTHDLSIIYRDATKVLCLNHKRVCCGLPKEVLTEQGLGQLFGDEVKYYHHYHPPHE